MEGVLLIFDRFRDAWYLNRANKSLYWPQVALTLVRVVTVLGLGGGFYSVVSGSAMDNLLFSPSWPEAAALLTPVAMLIGAAWLAFYLAGVIVEAGLYSMYKGAVQTGQVKEGNFINGVTRYALPFMVGDVLIFLVLIILLPVRMILGALTLTVGFGLISLVLGVALMMWKVALVMSDCGPIEAIKSGLRFAQANKLALTVLWLIRQAFLNIGQSGGSPSMNWSSNIGDFDTIHIPMQVDPQQIMQLLVVVVTVLAAFAVAAWSLFNMVFHVFFGLVLFLVWVDGLTPQGEVATDVV